MHILKMLVVAASLAVIAACGAQPVQRELHSMTLDRGLGKPIHLGATEPGPAVCEKVDQACEEENKRRIEALNTCRRKAFGCSAKCSVPCGPEPIGTPGDFDFQERHQNWARCQAQRRACEDRCDALCRDLPPVQHCSTTPIAATCSRCADHPVARVKTCAWPAWPPVHPPGSPVVVPCDQDWSWAGTGACSACRAQAVNTAQLGKQTCQCQYPDSQAAEQPWQRTCHFQPTVPGLSP